jgi:hypothetical protein
VNGRAPKKLYDDFDGAGIFFAAGCCPILAFSPRVGKENFDERTASTSEIGGGLSLAEI